RAAGGGRHRTNCLSRKSTLPYVDDAGRRSTSRVTRRRADGRSAAPSHRAGASARKVGYPQKSSSPPSPLSATLTDPRAALASAYLGKNEASPSGSSRSPPTRSIRDSASVAVNRSS